MSKVITCPKCGKIQGEQHVDHVSIKRIKLLVFGAKSMPRTCEKCGTLFDMLNGK